MKVNRSKQVRKYLRFFKMVYGIDTRQYHVLLDGNFIFGALKLKVDIIERLTKLLQVHEVKTYVLKSVVSELKLVGAKAQSALDFTARTCEVIDDDHVYGCNANDKTIALMKTQHQDWLVAPTARKRRYMVASQDKDLRAILGHVPGIPLLYLNKVTMVLEPPSSVSKDFNLQIEASKASLRPAEVEIVAALKKRKRRAVENIIDGAAPEKDATGGDAGGGGNAADEDDNEDDEDAATARPAERKKHKAFAANPLASRAASSDSFKQKKLKKEKYKRR